MRVVPLFLQEADYSKYQNLISPEEFEFLNKVYPAMSRWLIETYIKNKGKPLNGGEFEPRALDALKSQHSEYHGWLNSFVGTLAKQYFPLYEEAKRMNVLPPEFKDIGVFKSWKQFFLWMREEVETKLKTAIEDKKSAKMLKNSAKILFKDSRHLLATPLTYEASVKLGAHTSWCTANPTTDRHYLSYTSDGTLYIHRFLDENGSYLGDCAQLYVPGPHARTYTKVECRDRRDNTVDSIDNEFFDGIPLEIAESLMGKIERAGGFGGTELFYQIEEYASMTDNPVANHYGGRVPQLQVSGEFYLTAYTGDGDYIEVEDVDPEEAEKRKWSYAISLIGKGFGFPEGARGATGFDYLGGVGLMVQVAGGYSRQQAEYNASSSEDCGNHWHQAERSDNDPLGRDGNGLPRDFADWLKTNLPEDQSVDYIVFDTSERDTREAVEILWHSPVWRGEESTVTLSNKDWERIENPNYDWEVLYNPEYFDDSQVGDFKDDTTQVNPRATGSPLDIVDRPEGGVWYDDPSQRELPFGL